MYDVIVVGARCAGSPLAMLLARKGHRVLLVDRVTFPSDTISTQFIWQPGAACLQRWGLLDRVRASNCPPVGKIGFDPGPFQLVGTPPPCDSVTEMFAPRRTVLDKILVDAAAEAGVEVAQGFTVSAVTSEDGRVTGIRGHGRNVPDIEERAQIVIGADGRNSFIAKAVAAEEYNRCPVATCLYYSYWADVPEHLTSVHVRPRRFMVTSPTNDGLHLALVMFPIDEFDTVKSDIDRHFTESFDLVPDVAVLLRAGRRVERYFGTAENFNFFRKPYGDGWALAGDAGYHKDPITAQGISDAFNSVEWLTEAVHAGLSGAVPMQQALEAYHRKRDEHFRPMYEMTNDLASLQPPSPETQALLSALHGNQRDTDRFLGTIAGTVSIPEFYASENLRRIIGGAATATSAAG